MIVLGRLVAPYGVKGWFHLHPFGDDPASWGRMSDWWLAPQADATDWQILHPEAVKPHADGWVVKLLGVEDRSRAESLVGQYIAAPREAMPDAGPDVFYWADLIGLEVRNKSGVLLGKVKTLIETGANDVLVVKAEVEGKPVERLLPYVDAVVLKVDVAGGCINVDWEADW